MYRTAEQMKYESEEIWFPLSEDILAWDEDFHTLMLNDEIRMSAYKTAIKEVVKPNYVVVDIGTGTGILAQWALEAGAKKVYGIDVNKKILTLAEKRIEKANLKDKFIPVNKISYEAELPEKAEVVLSEILGNLGDNEDMTPILDDARKRFLQNNGVFLPKQIKTYLVPVSSPKAHRQIIDKKCRSISKKYELTELLNKLGIKNQFDIYYDSIIPSSSYLAKPILVKSFNFGGGDEAVYQTETRYEIETAGLLTGIKGYFIADLSANVTLDISGDDIEGRKTSDCLKHCYMPIENPVLVEPHDILQLTFSRSYPKEKSTPFRQFYRWAGKIFRDNKLLSEFNHGTYKVNL